MSRLTAGAIAVTIPVTAVVTVGTTVFTTPPGPRRAVLIGPARAATSVPRGIGTFAPATLTVIVAAGAGDPGAPVMLPRVWFVTAITTPVPTSIGVVEQVAPVPTTQTVPEMFRTAALSVVVSVVRTSSGTVPSTFPTRVIRLLRTSAESTSSLTSRLLRPRPVVSTKSSSRSAETTPVRRFTVTTSSPMGVSSSVFSA